MFLKNNTNCVYAEGRFRGAGKGRKGEIAFEIRSTKNILQINTNCVIQMADESILKVVRMQ